MPSHTAPVQSSTLQHRAHGLWRFVKRGLVSLAICESVVLVLWIFFRHDLYRTSVYSLAITLGCWFFIDSGRLALAAVLHRLKRIEHDEWPGWGWMLLVVLLGTAAGHSAGVALANSFTGIGAPAMTDVNPRQAMAILIVSLIPGVIATYLFYSRGRMSAIEAHAAEARRQAAETQLKLLESQLEPHMLFNTLANLRVLIGMDPPRAQFMLDRLIAFLRATLEGSRSASHSLASEFARINDYLELMKIRMGDRLQTELVLPPELAGEPVPPLLLQPLVENAIKHGLEPHVGGGRLEVSARREGDALLLCVRDTGAGLGAAPSDGTRFGLQQVRERLDTLHGARAWLELRPADDAAGGTVAVVRLPLAGA